MKLDDRFPDHPKVVGLSDKGFRLYVRGLCYERGHLTDGLLSAALVRAWANLKFAQELVDHGLWEKNPQGYLIHDWHDYGESRSQIFDRRRMDSSRKRFGVHQDSPGRDREGKDKQDLPQITRRLLEREGLA